MIKIVVSLMGTKLTADSLSFLVRTIRERVLDLGEEPSIFLSCKTVRPLAPKIAFNL